MVYAKQVRAFSKVLALSPRPFLLHSDEALAVYLLRLGGKWNWQCLHNNI